MRDDNPSPCHPDESPAVPLIQTASDSPLNDAEHTALPSPPPSATNSQYPDKSRFSWVKPLRRSKPLFRGFERPSFSRIAILTILCPTAYPAFYLLTFVGKDRSLFIVRLLVSTWCSGVGFALGYVLLKIGARHLEAASEFILVWHRDFLRLSFNSLGHCDSHEPRGWRNETPRSCQRLEQHYKRYARLSNLPVSPQGPRDFQALA